MNGLLQTLLRLGPARLLVLAGTGAAMIGLLVFMAARLSTPSMGLLYGDLDLKDSGEIAAKLDSMNVAYTVKGDGSSIMVPSDQVARLRVAMAEEGLPHGGSVGFELFDKPEGLGTTDFVQNINEMRALEGELERTISAIDQIETARVHLVLPKRELFSRQVQEPSASIMLKVRGGEILARPQIMAIQNLVASAVPGLKPFRVTIIDQNGNLLARASDDPGQSLDLTTDTNDQRSAYEGRLSRDAEEMLERSLGYGHVRVEVAADMDFDKVTTNSETYDPNGQVVRSTQSVTDSSQNNDGSNGDQPVSVQTNLPEGQQASKDADGGGSASQNKHAEETTNYEISKNTTVQTREAGVVKRLSVAVLVDGDYSADKDGKTIYQPRSEDEIRQISDLVKTAVGFDTTRGDQIKVVNMRFASQEDATVEDKPLFLGLDKQDLFKIFETLVLAVVAILVALLVVRPLLNRALEAARDTGRPPGQGMLPAVAGALPGPGQMGALAGPGSAASALAAAENSLDEETMIDIGQVEGRVKASSMRKIGEIVDKHPEEAVAIVRSWMYQSS